MAPLSILSVKSCIFTPILMSRTVWIACSLSLQVYMSRPAEFMKKADLFLTILSWSSLPHTGILPAGSMLICWLIHDCFPSLIHLCYYTNLELTRLTEPEAHDLYQTGSPSVFSHTWYTPIPSSLHWSLPRWSNDGTSPDTSYHCCFLSTLYHNKYIHYGSIF